MVTSPIFKLTGIDKYERLTIGLCLLVFLILVFISPYHEMGGYGVETDFYGSYALKAKAILSGEHIQWEDHGPGYIFILALFDLIFNDIFTAGKFITIVSTVLFGFFTFKVLSVLFKPRLAFFTVLLLLINILPYSILVSNDMFFAFVVALSIYLIYRKGQISYLNLFWGGLVAGYAYMTRMNAVILPMAVIFSTIFINPERWNWPERVKAIAIFCLSFLIGTSPWLIMNITTYGTPFVSRAHETIGASILSSETATGDFAWDMEKEVISKKYHSITTLIFSNFSEFVIFFTKNIRTYFEWMLIALLGFPAYLFLAPGAVLLFSRINRKQLSYFTIAVFGFLIYCILVFMPRFYIYILSFFLFLVVYFLFYEKIANDDKSFAVKFSLLTKSIFIVTVILLSISSIKALKKNITTEPLELKKISQLLRAKSKESDIMIARKPHLAYLSNMKVVVFPNVDSIEKLIDYAKEKKAAYLLYSDIEAKTRPRLKILQEPDKVPSNLQVFYYQDKPKIIVYKILNYSH